MINFCKTTLAVTLVVFITAAAFSQSVLKPAAQIEYCATQATATLKQIPAGTETNIPRTVENGKKDWRYIAYRDWCSGFWPGALWYLYEGTGDKKFKTEAERFTRELIPVSTPGFDHDLGFQVFNSFGNGYRLTKNPAYKKFILTAADSLATLFNPKIGTILSWPGAVKRNNWPHNTIVYNLMNLEMLFWASKNGGSKKLYDIAVTHAQTTMKNHFRADYSAYHVLVYDTVTGKPLKKITAQGYADSSMWARGQSWAIYGYTMCYRETKKAEFLDFAQKVADVYLSRLPADLIPYWDFNAPGAPNIPRDASAACITASALLELSGLVKDKAKAASYRTKAEKILQELTANYQSHDLNNAFLLHSTGHHPAGSEIDVSIIYADYYYLEALLRLKKLQTGKTIYQNL
jgi:unsaturated chondroitin disaccharide hydrolase